MPMVAAPDPASLLDALVALRPGDRPAALRAAGEPDAALLALAAEVQRVASAEAGRALGLADLLAALADDLGGPAARAEARSVRAMALAYAGRFDEALAACEESAALAGGAGLAVAEARARLGAVHPLASLGRYAEAIAAGERARAVFAAAGERDLEARAEINLGAAHEMTDDPRAAIACYDRAAALLDDDPATLGQLDSNRGLALIALDDYAGAEAAFTAAVERFDREGLGWGAAVAEENLAYLAVRQGRLASAMRHFERGRRYLERDDAPVHLARLLADQAEAFAAIGLPGQALAAWEEVIPGLEERGLAGEAAQARTGAGRQLLRLGRLGEAAAMLDSAAAAAAAHDSGLAMARIDALRAELALAGGDAAGARALAATALAALQDRPAEALGPRETLALAALAEGAPRAALAEIDAALPAAAALDLAPALADLRRLRGRALLAAGDGAGALAEYRAAVRELERVRGALQAERFRAAWLGSRLGLYEEAVAAALGQGPAGVAEAFGWIEAARGRALLDALGGAAALDHAPAADPDERRLLEEMATLRAELEWRYSDAAEPGEPSPRTDERRAAIRRIEAGLAALEDRLAAAGGVAGLYGRPLSLAETAALLPAGSALVEYFAAGGRMMAVVVADGQATAFPDLCAVAEIEELRTWFAFQVNRALAAGPAAMATPRGARMTADADRVLGELHRLLAAPLLGAIGAASRLIVAPHGPLHGLPAAAFRDEASGLRLIERFEVVTVPSASVLGRAPVASGGPPLVVGVADAAAPRIDEEAAAVAALLPAGRELHGAAATIARVREAAREAGTIHFACHGRFDADAPLASGLKLADGWLTAREIPSLGLRARLVTLSGCETGRSAVSGADDLAGLARAFLAAGAASLIYSLWLADDAATTELMRRLYRFMDTGHSPASALRHAQLDLLGILPHPAFWAAFVLGGAS